MYDRLKWCSLALWITLFSFYFQIIGNSQCVYFEDFSSSTGWTIIGSDVNISDGTFNFVNGAIDGVQKRAYKALNEPVSADDCWKARLEFTPFEVGELGGFPFTGHVLFALTETSQNAFRECQNIPCTGYPVGSQDAIVLSYITNKPPDWDIFFRIQLKEGTTQINGPAVTYNTLNTKVYAEVTKQCSSLILNIFSDPGFSIPLGDGPVEIEIPEFDTFYYIQHGNRAEGDPRRTLDGEIDNVCLEFLDCEEVSSSIEYSGCEGDGHSIWVNGTLYDENNPQGIETTNSQYGCDSTIYIDLQFKNTTTGAVTYSGCKDDGFSVTVNGTIYDHTNPYGIEILTNAKGCDSMVNIDLTFHTISYSTKSYKGCEGDSYSVVINGKIYDQENPAGTEVFTDIHGCDSTVIIDLVFQAPQVSEETYFGCQGDSYEIIVNGTPYNQQNPTGVEALASVFGCDSIVHIDLMFVPNKHHEITYHGTKGDGYTVIVNRNVYNENNPMGVEHYPSAAGCDSIVTINLFFEDVVDDCNVYIPNIFSPNGDQINDSFQPLLSNHCQFIIEQFIIYDRWGNIVFDQNKGTQWDGRFRGRDVLPGVYTYILQFKTEVGIDKRAGNITLIR